MKSQLHLVVLGLLVFKKLAPLYQDGFAIPSGCVSYAHDYYVHYVQLANICPSRLNHPIILSSHTRHFRLDKPMIWFFVEHVQSCTPTQPTPASFDALSATTSKRPPALKEGSWYGGGTQACSTCSVTLTLKRLRRCL